MSKLKALRKLFSLCFVAFVILDAGAQPTAKGFCFGANGMIYWDGRTTRYGNYNLFDVLLRPEISYQLTDRLALGFRLSVEHEKAYSDKIYYSFFNQYSYELFTRKLIPLFEGQAGIVLTHALGYVDYYYHVNSGYTFSSKSWQYSFSPSVYYMIGKNAALELQFGSLYMRKYERANPLSSQMYRYGMANDIKSFQIGFKYFWN